MDDDVPWSARYPAYDNIRSLLQEHETSYAQMQTLRDEWQPGLRELIQKRLHDAEHRIWRCTGCESGE